MSIRWSLAVHGGAGVIDPRQVGSRKDRAYRAALSASLRVGERVLSDPAKTPLDAVEAIVRFLEDVPLFNAGRGAVLNREGHHELEACVMVPGSCACVSGLTRTKNPVKLARYVMDNIRDSVHLSGPHAEEMLLSALSSASAASDDSQKVENSYFTTTLRKKQWEKLRLANRDGQILDHNPAEQSAPADHSESDDEHRSSQWMQKQHISADDDMDEMESELEQVLLDHGLKGTVGAVAWRSDLGCAAATSTGGLTNKRVGRLGDTPVVGASTFAHSETLALSATGTGEAIIRNCVAHDVHSRMRYGHQSMRDAVRACLHEDSAVGLQPDTCGVVAVDARTGEVCMDFNTPGMFRGCIHPDGRAEIGIWTELAPPVEN
eukprot:ANDGO_05752.mRNA.1 Isoaspartyl peptidase/L-asparaginase